MFVKQEPNYCFDLQRQEKKCVCGNRLHIISQGINTGYCETCAEKRKKFVDSIVGSIVPLDDGNTINLMLNVIEDIRKKYIEERLYYMIDKFFLNQKAKIYYQPYTDEDFIVKAYQEKILIMEYIFYDFPLGFELRGKNGSTDNGIKIFEEYRDALFEMIAEDKLLIDKKLISKIKRLQTNRY